MALARADTEVFYLTSTEYVPEAVGGIRYDDPAFGIEWPDPDRDLAVRT